MKGLLKSITKKEWYFVFLLALVMIFLTGIPYFYAYFMAPSGLIYNGLSSLTPGDNPVYYSYINQVKTGNLFLRNLFTSEFQPVGIFNIFWFSVGIFARVFNLSPILAFHLSRLILIPVFLVVAYLFISFFFKKIGNRKLCLIFLLFSAGLGGYFIGPLSLLSGNLQFNFAPNDIWIPESITFLTLYKTPHFIASLTLMLLIDLLLLLSFQQKSYSKALLAGFLGLIYFNFHPFYIPVILGSFGLHLLFLAFRKRKVPWQNLSCYLLFILVFSPSIFYHFWVLASNPVLQQRAWQNITLGPPFIFILIGYGFLWVFAIFGIYRLHRKKQLNDNFAFLLIWLLVSLVLVILPFQFQSRYTQGLHFPLVIFSIVGWSAFANNSRLKNHRFYLTNKFLFAVIFILLFGISNLFNLTRDFYYFTFPTPEIKEYFYFSKQTKEAMEFLANIHPAQVVLANGQNSLFIPVFSNNQVYLAHQIETIDWQTKQLYLNWFFNQDSNQESKLEFLKKNNIGYIFYSESEKNLGPFNPASKDYLKEVFSNSQVKIYQVYPVKN